MSTPYIGSVMVFAGNFAPRGWALCQGQLMSISQYTALFSLLGTTYGGNGQTTFGLPNLMGRSIVGVGAGLGLSNMVWGQLGGVENVTLQPAQMPAHNHVVSFGASSALADTTSPVGAYPAQVNSVASAGRSGTTTSVMNAYTASPNGSMGAATVSISGGSQPFAVRNPYLAMNYCIALVGLFPSRN
ncbi:phage tail protein [Granulicella cerasi]|uniref:Phage tail protein n=1 Tax=Granulicella cerasi TaxID=741063 RepID=A0ABW1ZC72_9BACT|nr:tail fiber protein [Granulicella cerasi]